MDYLDPATRLIEAQAECERLRAAARDRGAMWWRAALAGVQMARQERILGWRAVIEGRIDMAAYHMGIAESWDRFVAQIGDMLIAEGPAP